MTLATQAWVVAALVTLTGYNVIVVLNRLIEVVRAGLDVHMRVQVAIHKELCAMNDRFSPRAGAGEKPPLATPGAALDALRGGRAP